MQYDGAVYLVDAPHLEKQGDAEWQVLIAVEGFEIGLQILALAQLDVNAKGRPAALIAEERHLKCLFLHRSMALHWSLHPEFMSLQASVSQPDVYGWAGMQSGSLMRPGCTS